MKFCCDWVAHPLLKGTEAQNIVRQFDRYQEFMDAVNDTTSGQVPTADLSFLRDFSGVLRLSKFRTELSAYLRSKGLSSKLTDDEREWTNFLAHYTRVIEDCPLKCVGHDLTHVDEVVLKVMDVKAPSAGADYQVMIDWSWLSKKREIQCHNVQTY